jgi:hypothetical protein
MPTADQVKALVRSHAEGDDAQFYAVAMQVAARAARSGQTRFAKELRGHCCIERSSCLAASTSPLKLGRP